MEVVLAYFKLHLERVRKITENVRQLEPRIEIRTSNIQRSSNHYIATLGVISYAAQFSLAPLRIPALTTNMVFLFTWTVRPSLESHSSVAT
jgi:hypothetical protein